MQNKGAIRLLAILLALSCAYYLMFTFIANGIEKDAETFAQNYISKKEVVDASLKSSTSQADQKFYLDSVHNSKVNFYLDSLKKKTVYDIFITQYTV